MRKSIRPMFAPWGGQEIDCHGRSAQGIYAGSSRSDFVEVGRLARAIEGRAFTPRPDFSIKKKYPLLVVIHGGPTGVDQPIVNPDRYYPIERFVAKGGFGAAAELSRLSRLRAKKFRASETFAISASAIMLDVIFRR